MSGAVVHRLVVNFAPLPAFVLITESHGTVAANKHAYVGVIATASLDRQRRSVMATAIRSVIATARCRAYVAPLAHDATFSGSASFPPAGTSGCPP